MEMKITIKILLITVCLTFIKMANAAVWITENQWNSQYEESYGSWVMQSFNQDIFLKGPYKGFATDCADAAYAARLFFSFENKLPFAIKDSTGGNILITNEMSRFDNISDLKKRFTHFANYIFAMTGTYSVPYDTYPIKIDRSWLRPGTVNLHLYIPTPMDPMPSSSHTEIVKNILDNGVITFLSSTVPTKVRKLKSTSGFDFSPDNMRSGLRNWKWPAQLANKEVAIEGYSLEQFTHPNETYANAITNKLKTRNETTEEKKVRLAQNFCEQIIERIDVIKDSEAKRIFLDQKLKRCFNAQEYDDYSTPTRDKRLKETILELVRTEIDKKEITNKDIEYFSAYLDKCGTLEYIPGKKMTTTESAIRAFNQMYSSDPNQLLSARWGDNKAENIYCLENQ